MIDRYVETRELRSGIGDVPERVVREYKPFDIGSIGKIVVPPARCCDCLFWSKQLESSGLLICAVNTPTPEPFWQIYYDLVYTKHYCLDFDPIARK